MATKTSLTPTDIIIFGSTGDLTLRKIMPALYHRHDAGQLPKGGRIIACSRSNLSTNSYLNRIKKACKEQADKELFKESSWQTFAKRIEYIKADPELPEDFINLAHIIKTKPAKGRMFYLATPANVFGKICFRLKDNGVITRASRVVLEKPLGYNLESFQQINGEVLECFNEKQVYRIDHYLGKETVQNLMIIRFANNLFERVWNGDAIDHVQITVSETIGIEKRNEYYDKSGTLRDMVQNHLLQLLCLVAMEPPSSVDPQSIRDEKLKVLKALQPITKKDAKIYTVRGQYKAGKIEDKSVPSYLKEIEKKQSDTETFVAIKTYIDNWRWANIPFYLRTGKRLEQRYSEVVIQFRSVPHHIFPGNQKDPINNKLIIRLQPDESVKLVMITKIPGPGGYRLKNVDLNLSLTDTYEERVPEAYERLLMDVIRGNPTLFMRSDEVEAAWHWVDSIDDAWEQTKQKPKLYKAGSFGPKDSDLLMSKDGFEWHETE